VIWSQSECLQQPGTKKISKALFLCAAWRQAHAANKLTSALLEALRP
jgi:hypothetical protein